jgi:excisionase family DNA binding protein
MPAREEKLRVVQLELPEDVHKLLRLKAANRDTSLGELARKFVTDALKPARDGIASPPVKRDVNPTMTVAQAAEILGLSVWSVYQLLRQGQLCRWRVQASVMRTVAIKTTRKYNPGP